MGCYFGIFVRPFYSLLSFIFPCITQRFEVHSIWEFFVRSFFIGPMWSPPPPSLYTRIKYHGWFVRLRIDDEMFCAVCVIHIPLYICSEYKPYALRNEPFSNGRIWTYNFVWYKHTLSNDSMQRDSIIVEQSTLEYWNTRSISRIMSMISHYEPVFYVEYHLAVK